MNINEAFPSSYLRAADLGKQARLVTIREVKLEVVAENERAKPVIYFNEQPKGVVLNKTNSQTLAAMFGPETSGWTGRQVELYPMMVDFKGTATEGIRMRQHIPPAAPTPAAPASAEAPPPVPAAEGEPLNDDLPNW